jgi:hypothetical protein
MRAKRFVLFNIPPHRKHARIKGTCLAMEGWHLGGDLETIHSDNALPFRIRIVRLFTFRATVLAATGCCGQARGRRSTGHGSNADEGQQASACVVAIQR